MESNTISADIIVYLRQAHPCYTLKDMGNKVGVTRERARQICKRNHLPTKAIIKPPQLYKCLNCDKETTNKKFCSIHCSIEYNNPLVECEGCHKLFRRKKSQLSRRTQHAEHIFCSRECLGRWLGTTYGFIMHPKQKSETRIRIESLKVGELTYAPHPEVHCGVGADEGLKWHCSLMTAVHNISIATGCKYHVHHIKKYLATVTRIK
jgi:hypothetical protein